MKKTYTTTVPDRVGAFLKADACITELGLNITRISYNKAVDAHIIFLEVEGEESQLFALEQKLHRLGYLGEHQKPQEVVLMEFTMTDRVGSLLPVLELIEQKNLNISFLSSREDGSGYQHFRMGILMENGEAVSDFVHQASMICPVSVVDYDRSETVLDNTVFYLSFADEIAKKLQLSQEEKNRILVQSNRIMQTLEEQNSPFYKTFDYIGRIADRHRKYRGKRYLPRITQKNLSDEVTLYLCEPPCGSNTAVLKTPNRLLFVDAGFPFCFADLMTALSQEIPDFDTLPKELVLTHPDVDHCGRLDAFDRVYLNQKCADHYQKERLHQKGVREKDDRHAPYVAISKILSDYKTPTGHNFTVIGGTEEPTDAPLTPIGILSLDGLSFLLYEGQGGHVPGEMVLIEPNLKLVFSGDIYVNTKAQTKEQRDYNRIAPYLMTSVDIDATLAKEERNALLSLLSNGSWTIYGGHGAPIEI